MLRRWVGWTFPKGSPTQSGLDCVSAFSCTNPLRKFARIFEAMTKEEAARALLLASLWNKARTIHASAEPVLDTRLLRPWIHVRWGALQRLSERRKFLRIFGEDWYSWWLIQQSKPLWVVEPLVKFDQLIAATCHAKHGHVEGQHQLSLIAAWDS